MQSWCCYSVAIQSCPTLCDPVSCSTPGFPVLHHLAEPAQTHVHWVNDAIQPSHSSEGKGRGLHLLCGASCQALAKHGNWAPCLIFSMALFTRREQRLRKVKKYAKAGEIQGWDSYPDTPDSPRTEKPGKLQSTGSNTARQDWSSLAWCIHVSPTPKAGSPPLPMWTCKDTN